MSGGRAPTIANPFQDTGRFINQAAAVYTAASTSWMGAGAAVGIDWVTGKKAQAVDTLASPIMNDGKSLQTTKAEASNKVDAAETDARSAAYNDALSDNSLDAKTRQEVEEMYKSGATSTDIASKLNLARQGKGIYGIRKQNAAEVNVRKTQPGRAALSPLGRGVILGRGY